jgi:hypothetical protein
MPPLPASDNRPKRGVRFKQAEVTRALRARQQSGITIGSVEIGPDGSIVIKPMGAPPFNDADAAVARWQASNAR